MKIVSPVYVNMDLKFGESTISFKNGSAEVSEEVFAEIQSSGFPNIYAEGKNPGVKTKDRENFDKTLDELNKEYMAEIDRLKSTNAAKVQEIKELKQQLENLKAAYDKDVKELQSKLLSKVETPSPVVAPAEIKVPAQTTEEQEVRKDLESMKLLDLQKIATDQGIEESLSKKLTKKELIDQIMGKND